MKQIIQYDSRKCTENCIFVAITGNTVDGHDYIEKAVANGAKTIYCERNVLYDEFVKNNKLKINIVPNTRVALAELAKQYYENPTSKMKVIGVTGTNGKTTTTFLLKSIFETAGKKTGIIGTTGIYYNDKKLDATHTTPESLELCEILSTMQKDGVEFVIMEASSHSLHQHRTDCIEFDSALFTNLTHDHLDYHKTVEDYAKAKKILFDKLPDNGIAIVFDNSDYSEYILKDCQAAKKYFIGRTPKSNIKISQEALSIMGASFSLVVNNEWHQFKTGLLGRFNIDNAAISAATALMYGIAPNDIEEGLKMTKGAPGRMQSVLLKNGAIALVDYAHTPDALEKALTACLEIFGDNKENSQLICVFGCGGDRDKTKRPIMGNISSKLADISIVTNDNPRTENPGMIINQIIEGTDKNSLHKVQVVQNRADAIKTAVETTKCGDIIMIAGKGHENYQVLGTEKIHFDDKEELEKYC